MQDLVTCMQDFDCLPFDPASPTLRTVQSAMPASRKLVADFNSARAAGEDTLTSFLRERVFSKNTSLHASVPLSKRLTFAKEPGACGPAPVAGTSRCRGVYGFIQLQRHIEEEAKEQAHPDALSAMCRPARTLRRSRRHRNDLEYGKSNNIISAGGRWHPIQVVGLRAQGVIHYHCPPLRCRPYHLCERPVLRSILD